MMKLKPEDTIITITDSGVLEWLEREYGITGIVMKNFTAEDVKGKYVIGEIPAHIAQDAFCITSIVYEKPMKTYVPNKLRNTYEEIAEMEPKLFTYIVVPVFNTDPTDY